MNPEKSCGCGCTSTTQTGTPGGEPAREVVRVLPESRVQNPGRMEAQPDWVTGFISTPAGSSPVVSTRLNVADILAGWSARWKIRRMRYRVEPGLYAVGQPGAGDPVLVTANYKLTFDRLRQELGRRNVWILVLDTAGINVWCAAGKGTFSTAEVVNRVRRVGLERVVTHRALILPQLAAPGVSAHQVRQESGFRIGYGPVRAKDLPAFMDNGRQATPGMRTVTFSLADRLVVIPVELVSVLKHFLVFLAFAATFIFTLGAGTVQELARLSLPVLGAMLAGAVVFPVLLPMLPFRSFALNGWGLGLLWAAGASAATGAGALQWAGNLLLLPVLSAAYALAFTGTTTFTSQTGVNKEIRLFGRPMAVASVLGAFCMIVSLLL
jgi:hypothetical protein